MMGDYTVDVAISTTYLQDSIPSVEYNPIDKEFVVLWHTDGIMEVGGDDLNFLSGQRISPDGELIGPLFFPLLSIGLQIVAWPRAAHNIFTNEYMMSFSMGRTEGGWGLFVTKLSNDGTILIDPICLSCTTTSVQHGFIVFNSVRRNYLIVWNEKRYGNVDIFGIIVDENANILKDVFAVCAEVGDQYNPFVGYNSTDDTYLINWEDFRHVSEWHEAGDIYGVLLDGEGKVIVDNIAMCDDYGTPDASDQRHNNIAYNPDRNEFFVNWTDSRTSLDNTGTVGRIIKSDGTPKGPDFISVDALGAQIFPCVIYLPNKRMYFAVWEDNRSEPDTYWRDATTLDIYATLLNSDGEPIGSDFPLCIEENNQTAPKAAYCPVDDMVLIAWRDELEEDVPSGTGEGHIKQSGGNIMGKVYGTPSFLSGRVVEQGSGEPVEGASVTVVGPGYERTVMSNIGGWFNLPERFQSNGNYVAVIRKKGYLKAIETSIYKGEPLKITVELNKKE